MSRFLTRRNLFAGALLATPLARGFDVAGTEAPVDARPQIALEKRRRAALLQSKRPLAAMRANGDEAAIPNWAACYAKGLPQNQFSEVLPTAYQALLAAVRSGKHADFERIPKGGGRKLNNPEAAFTFHLEGGDPHTFEIPPAPSVTSQEAAVEASELYWQALARDVPFSEYAGSQQIHQAALALGVTPATIFRGSTEADLKGPYISQFLWQPIPYGSGKIEQLYRVPDPKSDFMTTLSDSSRRRVGRGWVV